MTTFWIGVAIVSVFALLFVFCACVVSGDCAQREEDAGLGRRS